MVAHPTVEPASIPMVIVPSCGHRRRVTLMVARRRLYPGISAARHDTIEALSYE